MAEDNSSTNSPNGFGINENFNVSYTFHDVDSDVESNSNRTERIETVSNSNSDFNESVTGYNMDDETTTGYVQAPQPQPVPEYNFDAPTKEKLLGIIDKIYRQHDRKDCHIGISNK